MQTFAWWPTVFVLLLAAGIDIRSRRIPNWLVVPFLLSGVVVAAVAGGVRGAGESLAGMILAAGVAGIFWHLRGLGMGDVKLLAAVGAWIGPSQLGLALVATAIAGGVLAVGYALWHRSLGRSVDGVGSLAAGIAREGFRPHRSLTLDNPGTLKVPYAVAIAAGTIFSFFAK